MKKTFRRVLVCILSLSMIATLAFGSFCAKEAKADEKIGTYLDLDNDEAEVNKEYKYYAYLYDDEDEPISGQTLTLTVQGEEYTAITDGDGCATFTLYFYSEGEHQFDVVYEGNDIYERCYDYEYIDVCDDSSDESEAYVEIPDYKTSVFVGEEYSLTAYLYDGYDDPIAGEELNLYVDGQFYEQIKTSNSGAVTFKVTFITDGTREVTVRYDGSDFYEYDYCEFNLAVRKQGDNRTLTYIDDVTDLDYVEPGEHFSYGATLYDEEENPISGKTIKMDINGESSGATKTDANGEFIFDLCLLEPGEYQIDFHFEGDNDYLACKGGSNIFAGDEEGRVPVYFGYDSIRSIEVGKTFQYHVSIYDDHTDEALTGKTLYLSIDGDTKELESVTNMDGEATFTLRFDTAGMHKIYVYFEGDDDYYGDDYEQRINAYVPSTVTPDNPTTATPNNTPTIQNKTVGKVAGLKAKNKKKRKAIVTWKKVNGAKKYQVKYAMNKKFKKAKTKVVNTNKAVFKKLKKKTYFFKVRGFSGTNYGAWCKAKKLKIKK